MDAVELPVRADEAGIFPVCPPWPVVGVQARTDEGWSLVDHEERNWRMVFLTGDGEPVGVLVVNPISEREVEVASVPDGPAIAQVRLEPEVVPGP